MDITYWGSERTVPINVDFTLPIKLNLWVNLMSYPSKPVCVWGIPEGRGKDNRVVPMG
jgi:hypothetical protein